MEEEKIGQKHINRKKDQRNVKIIQTAKNKNCPQQIKTIFTPENRNNMQVPSAHHHNKYDQQQVVQAIGRSPKTINRFRINQSQQHAEQNKMVNRSIQERAFVARNFLISRQTSIKGINKKR